MTDIALPAFRTLDVASDAAGNFVVVWTEWDGPSRAKARRVDSSGTPQGASFEVTGSTCVSSAALPALFAPSPDSGSSKEPRQRVPSDARAST